MDKPPLTPPPPKIGFKNEIERVRRKVPDVLRDYQDKRFWRMVDAPLTSRSYIKFYIGFTLFTIVTGGGGIYMIEKFKLFQSKAFRGNTAQEVQVMAEFPGLDEAKVYPIKTFSEKYRQRELANLNKSEEAKQRRDQQLKENRLKRSELKANENKDQTNKQSSQTASSQSKDANKSS